MPDDYLSHLPEIQWLVLDKLFNRLDDINDFQKWWPATYHLIGKDILTTHAVYWPTMLMSAEIELPRSIFAHGWWLMGESKMSKSLGNVINPIDLVDDYGVDPVRYY